MGEKIKVLVVPSDKTGVGYYRSLRPHTKMDELFGDKFDIDIRYDDANGINWQDVESLKKYDIINIHKGLMRDMDGFLSAMKECKESGVKIVLDLDDYWEVGKNHPHYLSNKINGVVPMIINNVKLADYVTTTTPIFAEEIKKHNPNVKVFVNAIDEEEEQFIPQPIKSDKLRFGFIMGSTHLHDMEMLIGMTNKLSPEIRNKIQIVLCGFDLRGTLQTIMPDGTIQTSPLPIDQNVWVKFEEILTDNYRLVSPEYKNFLKMYAANAIYPNEKNEFYVRRWTKDIAHYATHYNDIDVLLVPLQSNYFNSFKSELKLIEAGFMGKAAIASNFGPYTIGTTNFIEKGGKINENGNCILIDEAKSHKDWAKSIERLAQHPEWVEMLKTNLHNSVKDKYSLTNVTTERAKWYAEICGREF